MRKRLTITVRNLATDRSMPLTGDTQFDALKKKYAKGIELKGKTIGIIDFGRTDLIPLEVTINCVYSTKL